MLADFAYLRGLALLRRGVIALERLVALRDAELHPPHRPTRMLNLDVADTATLNAAYRRANPRYDGTDDPAPEDAPRD